ncbi:hypothetical protein GDO81_029522 [Engystomops pustulosus]|uniref:Cytoskeleton-associated protein 2 C-terminal domain-containing protein n=1 Tax=Engystomops pustulosus TaxID=76066 RepID=A0AAV6YJD4_ENGPU|nr:hypothetical protein GDO81_029522 [Engystomops pustulosus]
MGQKKMITGPVSPPKIRQNTLDFTSRRTSSSQETSALNKQMVQRRRTAPPGGNKVEGFKDECKKQSRESKQAGVTSATKETTTRASSMTTADTTSRPQTPRMTAEERKKQLQEWLASKGKTYKRPPMILPPKRPPTVKKANPCNRSFWEGLEEEEELRSLTVKINQTLSECLELIEKVCNVTVTLPGHVAYEI